MTKRLLFLLTAFILCSACGGNRHIRKTLDDVETYIESRPDSALVVLEALPKGSSVEKATNARYSLLYAKALDKNDVETTDLSIIQPAVDYYSKTKDFERYAESLFYYGVFQVNQGDYNSAIVSFSERTAR